MSQFDSLVFDMEFKKILHACGVSQNVNALKKRQVKYLEEYLSHVGALTAVLESGYFDRDYLEDYSRYYSRCFSDFNRKCCRIHFFNRKYTASEIESFVIGEAADSCVIKESYLGFAVIRPLPKTIIGRTCLAPYRDESSDRKYLALRDVSISFFGIQLSVRCMPFQEQDLSVSACATCALWSAFQVTASLFGHATHTPSEITSAAIEHGLTLSRMAAGNTPLGLMDMVYAVHHFGLQPLCVDLRSGISRCDMMLGNIYAYLNLGVPVVLMGAFAGSDGKEMKIGHAITVNGFRFEDDHRLPNNYVESSRILKLYCNDDQLGPYAKLERNIHTGEWVSQWADNKGRMNFVPHYLVLPIYHKIRVNYQDVWEPTYQISSVLRMLRVQNSWDIQVCTCNQFKNAVRENTQLSRDEKLHVLKNSLPHYIWKLDLLLNETKSASFCVDATDAGQGLNVVCAVVMEKQLTITAKKIYPAMPKNVLLHKLSSMGTYSADNNPIKDA